MSNQSSITSKISANKRWYQLNWPLCLFCNHHIKKEEGQLAHIIRRSWTSNIYSRYELQTMKLNNGLAHHDCHEIADNKPREAICLPRFLEVQFIGWLIDPAWHQEQVLLYDMFEFPNFEYISNEYGLHLLNYENHGDLLILPVQ